MQYNEISIIPEYSVSFKPQLSMSEVTVEPKPGDWNKEKTPWEKLEQSAQLSSG